MLRIRRTSIAVCLLLLVLSVFLIHFALLAQSHNFSSPAAKVPGQATVLVADGTVPPPPPTPPKQS